MFILLSSPINVGERLRTCEFACPCDGECVYALDDDPPGVFDNVKYDATCFVEVSLLVVLFIRCVCPTKTPSVRGSSDMRVCMMASAASKCFPCDTLHAMRPSSEGSSREEAHLL